MERDACPKRMTYGPCGGVRTDLGCEVVPERCAFADGPLPSWPGEPAPPLALRQPYVLTDLSTRPFDLDGLEEVAGVLRGSCDAVLVGEHQQRPDFPPVQMTAALAACGVPAWITLTCRDRNRVVLEQELTGLHRGRVRPAGVLCVTGDARAPGTRPEVTQVFDLDSTQLASVAAASGLPVAVAEAPHAPPQQVRPSRVLSKQRAGAQVCFLNHARDAAEVARFVSACRALGVTLPFVAGVAVYTDEPSARVLQAFPGLHLDDGRVEAVLQAADVEEAGIAAAVQEAHEVLAVEGVVGVNLSGLASSRGPVHGARLKAETARRIREGAST